MAAECVWNWPPALWPTVALAPPVDEERIARRVAELLKDELRELLKREPS
jgi:hypothetical protein